MRLPPLVLTAILSCSVPALQAAALAKAPAAAIDATFQRGGSLPKWASPLAEIPPSTRTDAVVTRLWEVQSLAGAAPAVLVNQAIQVNDRESLPFIGQHNFTYNPSYEKVRLLRVAILRGTQVIDRTASVNVRLLEREEALDAGVYGGEKTVQFLLDDVRVGDTLWLTYLTEGSNPVFGKQLDKRYGLARTTPVDLRRITMLYPAADAVQWRLLKPGMADADRVGESAVTAVPAGIDSIAPLIDKVGEFTRMRFEVRGSETIEMENSMPGYVRAVPTIQMSQYADWQAVARWAAQLFPPVPASPALKTLAARFAPEPDPLARASAALRYVQEEIRYFSVSMGENSHRPQPPEVVLKRGFGDCKDKSYLLVNLLAQLGIEAHVVLLNSATGQLATTMLPSPTVFDHAVVRVDIGGASYFVDPNRTGQKGRIDRLPAIFPGASGLLVNAAATGLLSFPLDRNDTPLFEVVEDLQVPSFEGDAVLEARLLYRSHYAEWARRHYGAASPAQLKREVLARYEKLYPGATLTAAPALRERSDEGGAYEVLARLKLPKPVTSKDGLYMIDYDSQIMDDSLGIPAKVVRQFPLALPQGAYRGRYRLTLHWPESVAAADLPAAATLDTPWFRAHEEYALRGNVISHQIDYKLKHASVAAADVPALSRQAKGLNSFASGSWRVGEGAARPSDYANFSLRDYWMVADAQDLPDDSAKPADAAAVCGAAREASRLLLAQAPLVPAELQAYPARLATQPDNPDTRACKLWLAFEQQRFADVVKLSQPAMLAVAWARLLAGDGAGARAQLDGYLAQRRQDGTLTALDGAHAAAIYQRSGAALPDSLRAFAGESTGGPWPRPMLALQAGLVDEAAMTAALQALPAWAREVPQEEAWFFLGQRRLAAGDKAGARAAFRAVVEQGSLRGLNTPVARAGLAALDLRDSEVAAAMASARVGDEAATVQKLRSAASRSVAEAQTQLAMAYYLGTGVKRDPAEALRLATLADAGGNPDATNMLGAFYLEGKELPRDIERARPLLQRAADHGAIAAPRNMALLLNGGQGGTPPDQARILAWLRLGAARNDGGAQSALASAYQQGVFGVRDPTQAWYWASRAAARGDAQGARQLASMLVAGEGVTKNPAEAVRVLAALGKSGDVDAMLQLAHMHADGSGVAVDQHQASVLIARAASKGSLEAQTWQAARMLAGIDGKADPAAALALLEKAVAAGYPAAAVELSQVYFGERGQPKDAARGEAVLRRCAESGAAYCQAMYASALHFNRLLPRDYAAAAGWYQKAADQNFPLAINNLADLYENGQGVGQDYARAISLYRRAAQQRLPIAFISLGSLYEKGLGVPADPQLAYTMYFLAELNQPGADDKSEAAQRRQRLAKVVEERKQREADTLALQWRPGVALPGEAAGVAGPAH